MSKKERNKEIYQKGFISDEGLKELDPDLYEEQLTKEIEEKKAAFRKQLYSDIDKLDFRVSQ